MGTINWADVRAKFPVTSRSVYLNTAAAGPLATSTAKAGSYYYEQMMEDGDVLAKRDAAVKWCNNATAHAKSYGGKPWRYVLIPHDEIADNVTLDGLAARFAL